MAAAQCIERLGAWEGYELEDLTQESRGAMRWTIVKLRTSRGAVRHCSGWQEAARSESPRLS